MVNGELPQKQLTLSKECRNEILAPDTAGTAKISFRHSFKCQLENEGCPHFHVIIHNWFCAAGFQLIRKHSGYEGVFLLISFFFL